MSKESIPDWLSSVVAVILLIVALLSGYGGFSSSMASIEARLVALEKVQEVSIISRGEMENELDVLWIDTQRNKDSIQTVKETQSSFNDAVIRLADATDRLSISVAKLEERVK